jgi:hypothetical protein
MKITFEDGSFIMFDMTNNFDKLNLIMCGLQNSNKLTMSSSKLNREQVEQVVKFLESWLQQPSTNT